ncbi:hypothetical protein DNK34_21590 [Pseudomonas dryadis]|uniref:Uncharacterized protein n=1 Tax=Phytopseudomonas dryadis TaxID=2487520 RepID=A0ABY1Z4P4_9GAMM|nr:hypothetical protein DNK34_21590 [Pseudomonas dryadis]TBV14730.1 hypothetical protein DNK41_19470 [Pseudomonas sp. FRB 230]
MVLVYQAFVVSKPQLSIGMPGATGMRQFIFSNLRKYALEYSRICFPEVPDLNVVGQAFYVLAADSLQVPKKGTQWFIVICRPELAREKIDCVLPELFSHPLTPLIPKSRLVVMDHASRAF